jgi:hypothetical protein
MVCRHAFFSPGLPLCLLHLPQYSIFMRSEQQHRAAHDSSVPLAGMRARAVAFRLELAPLAWTWTRWR